MSKHIYRTKTKDGREVDVYAGWDKPMQRFYLVVEDINEDDEDKYIVYSNLLDPNTFTNDTTTSFNYFLQVLDGLGIELPAAMIDAIEDDRVRNAVNEVKDWNNN